MNETITIVPTSATGIGSFIYLTIGNSVYKSTPVDGEFNRAAMDAAMDELYNEIPQELVEAVELKYISLCEAMQNAEAEAAYREQHPEEFINDNTEFEPSVEEITE